MPILMDETFFGAGYKNTWTEAGTGTIDEDATPSSGHPGPTECLNVANAAATAAYTYWNAGVVNTSPWHSRAYFRVVTNGLTTSTNLAYIHMCLNGVGAVSIGTILRNNGGQLVALPMYYAGSDSFGTQINISTGVWYRSEFSHTGAGGDWAWRLYGDQGQTLISSQGAAFAGAVHDKRICTLGVYATDQASAGEIEFACARVADSDDLGPYIPLRRRRAA